MGAQAFPWHNIELLLKLKGVGHKAQSATLLLQL